MLQSLRIENFKSIRSAQLHVGELTLLIGWNGAGKSNVLEALELLCWCARTPRLTDLSHAIDQRQVRIRGNVKDLRPIGVKARGISYSVELALPPASTIELKSGRLAGVSVRDLALDLSLDTTATGVLVASEVLRSPQIQSRGFEQPLYAATRRAAKEVAVVDVQYQNFRRGTNPWIQVNADHPCFTQLSTPVRFPDKYDEARQVLPAAARRVTEALSAIQFLDPAPSAMRGYAFRDEDRLQLHGQNVSAVLYQLHMAGRTHEILSFVQDLPERRLDGLAFLETPRAEVMVQTIETFGSTTRHIPAALMSDGMLRVLAIAAALLSAEPGTLVVIEEIDNGVHPSRAHALLAAIRSVARSQGLRVLITTHHPALQDALPDELLGAVTLAFRDPKHGATTLARLQDLAAFPRIAAAGPLGHLVTGEAFERWVKSSEAQPPKLPAWLLAGEEG